MWYEILVGSLISVTAFNLFITLPFYLLVLVAIIKYRKVEPFNSEFFVIFYALGISDINCYFLYLTKKIFFLGYVPGFFRPYNEPNAISSLYYVPFWASAFVHFQMTFLLMLNRYISIVWPRFHSSYWTVKKTYVLIGGCVLFSIGLALPVSFTDCYISQYTAELDNKNYTFQFGPVTFDAEMANYLYSLWAFHVYGLIVSALIFYLMMVRTLKRENYIINKKKIELQLLRVVVVIFIANLCFTIYFFLRDYVLINISSNKHLHEWILYFMSDIYDLHNGVLLWLTSSSVRQATNDIIRKYFCCGASNKVVLLSKNSPQTNVNTK